MTVIPGKIGVCVVLEKSLWSTDTSCDHLLVHNNGNTEY